MQLILQNKYPGVWNVEYRRSARLIYKSPSSERTILYISPHCKGNQRKMNMFLYERNEEGQRFRPPVSIHLAGRNWAEA